MSIKSIRIYSKFLKCSMQILLNRLYDFYFFKINSKVLMFILSILLEYRNTFVSKPF